MANEKTKIAKTLDSLHRYAASAEGEKYFSLFTENALYIGTDVSETWSIDEFKQFAAPYFNQGKGWLYTVKSRTITLSQNQGYAWFVEVLDNEKYGVSRGTGVLVNSHGKWRIAQYHLTFPIPNSLAESITQQIKSAAK
ncbi:MAG: nuclear transport factor 2 family protein [Gammaproteobacteria bacterium]|nr:nuclear transport factor 2 family protein [Gammaproteobacteria bacterium]